MKRNKYFTEGLQSEAFQVILKPSDWPNMIRITYSKPNGGVLSSIEELDASENVISGCNFRGRSASCTEGGEWIKEDKAFFSSFKSQDWYLTDIFIEQYFKKH